MLICALSRRRRMMYGLDFYGHFIVCALSREIKLLSEQLISPS